MESRSIKLDFALLPAEIKPDEKPAVCCGQRAFLIRRLHFLLNKK